MTLAAGAALGPYEVIELLGAGGMGEVYRARDPRLGRDVAVKVLPEEVAGDAQRLGFFEREARAVAALNHPNILTVFDVGTHEGVPYVVTELLEGENFRELVSRRTPTVWQILGYALQAARGLEAAHAKDIVHRDLKPENLFLTTDGRVKILDFGLAKLVRREEPHTEAPTPSRSTAAGHVVGTVAYMSPEQARGHPVDARSDVFSFGVVLYELLAGRHPFRRDTAAATLTAIVEETPADLASLSRGIPPAVSGIVRRCLDKAREERHGSGHDVVVALEAVLAAPTDAAALLEVEERSPYPGLSSFTEKDAGVFFGREREVEELWGRIRSRKLLAVIGPSGVGKTSFVRAGVVPSRPEGWVAACATPGANAALGLARALTPRLVGDAEAVDELLSGLEELKQTGGTERVVSATKRWRSPHGEALLVIDQFEELFTLNPPETQARIAALLRRLASEADVHVVLSLRDDFLIRCSDHEPLAPVFSEITPLTALSRDGLRRAVVEPAKKQGYRFDDDGLVEDMVSLVEGNRGALPLLAFAVARLWEKRDREDKLLTRAAYQEIAGVEGALAQHAEATMDRIGSERQGLVREIFRNLVTAQGTRAVIDREELLSAFPEREGAQEVLDQLIDARLLTSYEVEGKEGEPSHHRVEVVHESLLKAWPRLVRWQTQDEDGAQLRDQLKQAAHLWEEKSRSPDLLWSGTAFREFELWRERYPGKLTALEEDFARSMAERARRKRRLVSAVAAAAVLISTTVAIAIGVSRHEAILARERAEAEARRAEASKLLALGRLDLETHPTAALAYARKSLELADTPEARRFALEVLWRGPVARILPATQAANELGQPDLGMISRIVPSPDGRWLATLSGDMGILLFPRDGGPARALPRQPDGNTRVLAFGPLGDILITGGSGESLRFWSLPDLQEIRSVELGGLMSYGWVRDWTLFTFTRTHEERPEYLVRAWPLPDGEPKVLGAFTSPAWDIDPGGTTFAYARGRTVRVRPLETSSPALPRVLGASRDDVLGLRFASTGDRLASRDKSGEIRLWSLAAGARAPLRILEGPEGNANDTFLVKGDGSAVATGIWTDGALYVWDLHDPPDAQPAILRRPDEINLFSAAFDPNGQWLVASDGRAVAFWPLSSPRMRALHGGRGIGYFLRFTADGRWLVSCPSGGDATRLWPLSPADGSARNLTGDCFSMATHPASTHVLVGTTKVLLVPIEGGPPRQLLDRWEGDAFVVPVAFDVEGRRAVASPYWPHGGLKDPKQRVLRIWDLESGQERVFSVADITDAAWMGFEGGLEFAPDGSLFASGAGGVRHLVLPDEPGGTLSSETVYAQTYALSDLSRDGRHLLVWASLTGSIPDVGCEELLLFDLREHTSRRITTHGGRVRHAALDASGRIVITADIDGVVRAGPATGEEPHLLLGQTGAAFALDVSSDRRWIASWSQGSGEVVHLWPMPDVTRPPFHTLPYDELMAKLRALTNLQVVEDTTSATGYKLEIGPFPGWETVPTW